MLGTTTIYVTHDQVEAMTMGDRIMVLRAGRIQQVGEPETLYNYPANIFVAGFLGSPAMNLMKGRLEGDGDGVSLVSALGSFPLPRAIVARLKPYQGEGPRPVRWGIRAEDASIAPPETAPTRAMVDLVEGLGSDAYVSATVDGDTVVVRTPPDTRPLEGEQVGLKLNWLKVHLFDPETEETLLERPQG